MRQPLFKTALLSVAGAVLLASCSPKQDLKHIEPEADLSLGLAIPVGTINLKIDDFLGKGNLSNFLKVRPNDSVIYFQDTFNISRQFHEIDISQYVSNSANVPLNIYNNMPAAIKAAGFVVGDGVTSFDFTFPMEIKFDNINTNADNERIDSLVIKSAEFTSYFNVANINLDWDEIKSIDIVLDNNAFHRKDGNVIHLPIEGKNFGADIPIIIDEFTLNLMKDVNQTPGYGNSLTEAKINVNMSIVPRNGKTINVNAYSQFNYTLNVKFIDYYAIYGYFRASNQMYDEDTIVLSEHWDGWNDLLSLHLPLAHPEIYMQAKHYLGVPLTMYGRYLWVKSDINDQSEEPKYATFNRAGDQHNKEIPLPGVDKSSDYDTYAIGEFTFDHGEDHGHLDKLFAIRPNYMAYKFDIVPNYSDPAINNQARITKNTNIELTAITTVPLEFNEFVDLTYTDTLTDVKIDQFSLDSLIEKAKFVKDIETANLKLIITTTNYIPFDIRGHFSFIDYKNDTIPINVTPDNWIRISGPGSNIDDAGDAKVPGTSVNTLELDKENMVKLSRVKAIKFEAGLGNNPKFARLKSSNNLEVKISIAFDVKAALDMDKLFDFNQEQSNN